MRPLARFLSVGLSLLIAITLPACKERHSSKLPANDSASLARSTAPSTPADTLATILREKNSLLREHLLASWAMEHSPTEVFDAIAALPDGNAMLSLLWLIEAKQPPPTAPSLDLHFDLFHHLQSRRNELLGSPVQRHAPSLTDRLRQLAATGPDAALRQAAAARVSSHARGGLLAAILTTIAQTAPEDALARLADHPEIDAPATRADILRTWAKSSPEAAFAWTRTELPQSETADELASEILTTWADRDRQAALDFALALPDDAPGSGALPTLLAGWLREAPAESATWLAKLDAIEPPLLEAAVKGLSASHPRLVADLLTRFDDAPARNDLTPKLLLAWHRQDPRAAIDWFSTQPRDSGWMNTLNHVAFVSDQHGTQEFLALARLAPADANLTRFAQYVAGKTSDPTPVLAWLLTLGDTTSINAAMQTLLPKLGHATPEAMLAFARALPTEAARQAAVSAAVKQQLADNPAATARLLQNLPANEARLARAEVARTWVERDINGALAHAADLPPGEDRDTLGAAAMEAWSRTDPTAALTWALEQPWTSAQSGLGQAIYTLAQNDVATAATALSALPPGPAQTGALRYLLDGGSAVNPALTAQTLSTLGSPEFIGQHAHRVIRHYIKHDQTAAITWMRALPAGVARDGAMQNARSDLPAETALALTDLVTPGEQRLRYVEHVLTAYHALDQNAAELAIVRLPLTSAEKEQLRATLKARR